MVSFFFFEFLTLGGFSFYIKYYTHENTQVLYVKNSFWKRKFTTNTKILNFFLEVKKSLKLFFFVKFQKLSTTNTTTKWDMSQCRAQFSENETKTIRTPPLNCLYYYIHSPFIRIFTLELYLKKHLFLWLREKKTSS